MCKQAFVLVTVVIALVSVAHAAEGRIPLFEPTVITAGGHYFVTRDITAPGTIVSIQTSGVIVTLDLNGHTLTSQDLSPVISAGGDGLFVIRNGAILGGSDGILGSPSSGGEIGGFRIESVVIAGTSQNGIHITDSSRVEVVDCEIYDPGDAGVVAVSEVAQIDGNFINSPGGDGIRATGRPQSGGGVNSIHVGITDNVVDMHATGQGIQIVDFAAARVIDNSIITGTGAEWGIKLHVLGGPAYGGALVQRNTVRGEIGNNAGGIEFEGNFSDLNQNVVTGMGADGIRIEGSANTIRRNVASDNGAAGIDILIGSYNLIEENSSTGNFCPIDFNITSFNNYRNNMLPDNTNPIAACGNPNTDSGGNIF